MGKCDLHRIFQGFQIGRLADTYRGACICRLDEQREAQCFRNGNALFVQLVQVTLMYACPLGSLNAIVVQHRMGHTLIHAHSTAQNAAAHIGDSCHFHDAL